MSKDQREVQWKFYLSAEDAWEGMLKSCSEAKHSINFEQYIFSSDEISKKFASLLIKKAKEGVRVRLLCDAVGSQPLFASPLSSELVRSGIELIFFNPISPWWLHQLFSWFLRDHRKILTVDGKIGFTGGVGVETLMFGWRDTHVRISGPIVESMDQQFERLWDMAKKGKRFSREKPKANSEWDFAFVGNSPSFRQRHLYKSLLAAIRGAQKYIYLSTPYFIPDGRLFKALKRARLRGVDIRLIVPKNSDHTVVDWASRSYFTPALRADMKIFRFKNRIFHAKTVVVDDEWATVGSANLDNLSLLLNYEGNIISTNKDFVKDLKEQFAEDLENCEELVKADWIQRSVLQKFFELLTYPLHRLM